MTPPTPLTPSLLARLENAVRSETRGELEAALERYRSVLDHDADNFEALSLLGKLECRVGDYGAAVFHLQRAARLVPDRPDIHLTLGYALANAGEQRRSVRAFLDALEADPEYAPAFVSLGCVFAQHEQHDLARRAFNFARQTGADYPEVHYQLGKYYANTGHTEPALAALLNADRLGGRFDDIHLLLARLYCNLGNYQSALDHLRSHAEARPRDTEACVIKACALLELGHYDDALKASQLALQFEPRNVDALVTMGRIHFLREDLNGALRSYQAAISMNTDAHAAHAGLSELCAHEGQINKALEHLKRAGDPKTYGVGTALLCARLLHARNRTDEAIRLLSYRLRTRSDAAAGRRRCHLQIARLHESEGDFAKAFRHFSLANKQHRAASADTSADRAVIRAYFDQDRMARLRRVRARTPLPVFLVGLPGFALDMIRSVLACHPDIAASDHRLPLGELALSVPASLATPLPFPEALTEARRAELDVLAERFRTSNFSRVARAVLDSHVDSWIYLGFAHVLFPNMKIIQVEQQPADLALDLYTRDQPGRNGEWSTDLSHIRNRIDEFNATMSHWVSLGDFPVLKLGYEQLVRQPAASLERVLGFMGVDSHQAVLERLRRPQPDGDLLSQARGRVNRSAQYSAYMTEFFEPLPASGRTG